MILKRKLYSYSYHFFLLIKLSTHLIQYDALLSHHFKFMYHEYIMFSFAAGLDNVPNIKVAPVQNTWEPEVSVYYYYFCYYSYTLILVLPMLFWEFYLL